MLPVQAGVCVQEIMSSTGKGKPSSLVPNLMGHDTSFKAIQIVENGVVSSHAIGQWTASLLSQGGLSPGGIILVAHGRKSNNDTWPMTQRKKYKYTGRIYKENRDNNSSQKNTNHQQSKDHKQQTTHTYGTFSQIRELLKSAFSALCHHLVSVAGASFNIHLES